MRYTPSEFYIAREAWPFAVPLGFAAILCLVAGLEIWAIVLFVLLIYVVWFFRNPNRSCPPDPSLIISPADGKVVAAGIVPHPDFPDGQALRVAVFMNLFSVHINWSPCSGRVVTADYIPGKFLNAMESKCGDENERKVLTIDRTDGAKVIVKLIAGLVARRIVCPIEQGDEVTQGEKIGLIRFGSRAEVLVPHTSSLEVYPGMNVRGGETVLAVLRGDKA